jgi:hypothetical protein
MLIKTMLDLIIELRTVLLPLLLFGVGLIIVLISFSQKIAWRLDWPAEKLLRLLPVGLITVVIGFAWLIYPEIRSLTNALAQTNAAAIPGTPTPLPPPFISINAPLEKLSCQTSNNTCWFKIEGIFGGVFPHSDYRIYTFVFPTDPQGPGYYLQDQLVTFSPDGNWTQNYAAYGDRKLPAKPGQKLTIQAVLVAQGASYNGTPLTDLPPTFYLGAIDNIEGIIALTEPITLVVE